MALEILLGLGWFFALIIGYRFLKLRESNTRLEVQTSERERAFSEQKSTLQKAEVQLKESFQSMASQALSQNNESFLKLASERLDNKTLQAKSAFDEKVIHFQKLILPIQETLKKVEDDLNKVEKSRSEQYGRISEQITNVMTTSENLRKEASTLSNALKRPGVRGSWGEMQLKRVVELAGMSEYCDFEEQVSVRSEDANIRPDMVIHLPNKRVLVVDSKAVMDAFLEAIESENPEVKKIAQAKHAENLRKRVRELSMKAYWDQFEHSPDYVILFLPNEALLYMAVETDRSLLEDALKDKIVIATPTNLVALLKAVAYGWKQEQVTENAKKIIDNARELYERINPWIKHMAAVGSGIESTMKAYNSAIGSLETRILPAARKFQELGLEMNEELKDVKPIELSVRDLKE